MKIVATDGKIYIQPSLVSQQCCGIKCHFRLVFITQSLAAFEYIFRGGYTSVKYYDVEIYVRIYTLIKMLFLEKHWLIAETANKLFFKVAQRNI